METKLEQLINNTPFHELSVQEKAYVLENITEIEYNQFHEIITSSKVVFESEFLKVEPEKRVKENLSNAFKTKNKEPFFDKIVLFLLPVFRESVYKPALALGMIIIFFYVMMPKEKKPVEIAKIRNQKSTLTKEIIKTDINESDGNVKSMNQLIKPIFKNTNAPISELNEKDFLAGTERPFNENEKMGINCGNEILLNDDTFMSIEEFVSYTTIQNPNVESEQLTINPEDLK